MAERYLPQTAKNQYCPSFRMGNQQEKDMFLVVWTSKSDRDLWKAFDTERQAIEYYEALIEHDIVFTASVCKPIKSTEAHYVSE